MGVPKTSDNIQIIIRMPNPSQEPPVSSKALNEDLKDKDVLCTFKIKIESQNLDHGYIKDQWPYPNQDQDAKPHSGTSSVLQSPKWGLKGHGCSLHLQNEEREPIFGSWVYQRPVTYKINFEKKNWNMGVSKTTYLYFGSWEDSKLLGAKLIRVKIKLVSWASLSWVFWAKLIWVKSEFERWASLRQTNLSQKWIWELIISSELSFSEPNYSESKLNLRAELPWAELLGAKLIWVKIKFESWASLRHIENYKLYWEKQIWVKLKF